MSTGQTPFGGQDWSMTVVLIAYDGTPNARRAVEHAGAYLAVRRAFILTIWSPMRTGADPVSIDLDGPPDPVDPAVEEEPDIAFADAQRTNLEGAQLARSVGLAAEPMCIPVAGTVWRTIITVADNINAGLIVTGTRGTTGLRSLMQSSVSDRVLRHGGRPMLIVPPGG
jgi:nucleotide-binding universal stress UspA family protein